MLCSSFSIILVFSNHPLICTDTVGGFRATMQRYIQKHEDKELIGSATNMATMSTANPWANEDTRSLPGPQQSCDNSRPLLKQSNTQNGGSQMLLLLLRLRQCCCHLSLMKDVCTSVIQGQIIIWYSKSN